MWEKFGCSKFRLKVQTRFVESSLRSDRPYDTDLECVLESEEPLL